MDHASAVCIRDALTQVDEVRKEGEPILERWSGLDRLFERLPAN